MCFWSVSWIILGFYGPRERNLVGQKSIKAIDEAVPLTTKTEVQSLLGKINFIRRFISNLSKRVLPFSPLLKLKNDQEFKWGDVQQKRVQGDKRIYEMSTCAGPSTAK